MSWRIAIDTGGTFTDVVALNELTGQQEVIKVNSTPKDPSVALVSGITQISEKAGFPLHAISNVMHGTTAATNAILENDYPPMGLIVTRGFRDILEIRRQDVPGDFGDITWWIKPDRVVPLDLVREVSERIDYRGNVIRSLDDDEVREIALEYKELGIDALAVSFIHSYVDPAHEQRCRELIAEVHPSCFVSLSSDIIREYREYERTQGTCLNTGLMPLMSSYIGRIEKRFGDEGIQANLYIMKSSGGVAKSAELVSRPLNSVLSGPAAGVMAAAINGPLSGFENLLTLDVGGTSADIALIEGSMPRILNSGRIEDYEIKVPMVDMTTVGAGGGSIAWIADNGALRVGPESAGSQPGPVCYGRGGTRPTVTDAHLVLGRISPSLLDGSITLDISAAEKAIDESVAHPLGLSLSKAADGILELAVQNMIAGIRLVSVSRGRDPRNFTLLPFGGGGPMHSCLVADELGITSVLVPTAPGAMSAEGLLLSDVRVDHAITSVQRESHFQTDELAAQLIALREKCDQDLVRQGFPTATTRYEAFAEMRYMGQAYELRVPLALDVDPGDAARETFSKFHGAHEDRYGFSHRGQQEVELVGLSLAAFGALPRPPRMKPDSESRRSWRDFHRETRKMFDRKRSAFVDCNVYRRPFVKVDDVVAGPCVVEQYDTTTVVDAGWTAASRESGVLILRKMSNN
jgi:N-methylhydantoinase A